MLLDGVDVRDVTQESIGYVMGMVLQEPFLFSKLVLENVRYNTRNATEEDVVRACKEIGAHDFIMRLEDGYHTVLEQRGSNLSVGQRQLLSFARALVADPQILVLDEATSALDSEVEAVIQESLTGLMTNKTVIAIAHRLSTIAAMDHRMNIGMDANWNSDHPPITRTHWPVGVRSACSRSIRKPSAKDGTPSQRSSIL